MKRSKKSTITTLITMLIVVGLIFAAFIRVSKRENAEKSEKAGELTEVEKLLAMNLREDYPPTAREVVKRYGRIVKCIHSGSISDEEVRQLGEQLIFLYSDELLLENPSEDYLESLQNEVKEYTSLEKVIFNYAVDSSSNTVTWTDDGIEYARIFATFTTKEKEAYNKTYEEFLLKRDQKNEWKILGWRLAEPEDMK